MTPTTWLLTAAALLLVGGARGAYDAIEALGARGRAIAVAPRGGPASARWLRRPSGAVLSGDRPLVPRVVPTCAVCGLVVAAMWAGPLGLAGVATLGVGGRLLADLLIARRAARARDQAADAVALVAAELCAGSALPEALRAAVQVAPAHADTLAAAARAADRGDDAGAVLVGRAVDGAVFALGHALRVAGACGAGVADVLGRVGDHLAGRAEVRRGVATALAGPRASCALLAGLPVLGIVMGSAMGAHPARFLLADPAGQWVAGAGALLDVVGVLWVRALVRRAAPP